MRLIIIPFFLLIGFITHAQSKGTQSRELYEESLKHYRTKEFGIAREHIARSLDLQPSADAYYLSGLIHEAQGREIRAIADYEATLQLEPEYREALFQKGLLYLKNNDPGQAIMDFGTLMAFGESSTTRGVYFEVDPSDNLAVGVLTMENSQARIYYYRGLAFQKLGERARALEDFDKAISVDRRPEFFNARALLLESIGDKEQAILNLREAIQTDPQNHLAWYNLVRLDETARLPQELQAGDAGPTATLLASRAHEEGNYDEALRYYNLTLTGDQKDPLMLINRGRVLAKLNKQAEARLDFMEAKRLDPGRVEAIYLIGNTFFFQKQYDKAVAFYNEYITVNPSEASVWYNGAVSYLNLGNDQEACHYLSRAARLGMKEASALKATRCEE